MNLLYLAKPKFGGWVSFTAHLSLKEDFKLYRITNTNEKKTRPFGYGVNYQNIKIGSLPKNLLITAIDKNFYKYLPEIPDGTHLVIHDPTELKKELLPHLIRFNIITIRDTVQKLLLDKHNINSVFMPHPFYPYLLSEPTKDKEGVVSVSRIDYDKHTDVLIDANKLLDSPIDIYGAKNTLYIYRKLGDTLDQYYKGCFDKDFIELDKILSKYKYMIDLSAIKGDGGGSQYTFLEAIYHGNVLILSKAWLKGNTLFENEKNCLIVNDAEEIKELVDIKKIDTDLILENSKELLDKHLNADWSFNDVMIAHQIAGLDVGL